jgi:hypothetical protein
MGTMQYQLLTVWLKIISSLLIKLPSVNPIICDRLMSFQKSNTSASATNNNCVQSELSGKSAHLSGGKHDIGIKLHQLPSYCFPLRLSHKILNPSSIPHLVLLRPCRMEGWLSRSSISQFIRLSILLLLLQNLDHGLGSAGSRLVQLLQLQR